MAKVMQRNWDWMKKKKTVNSRFLRRPVESLSCTFPQTAVRNLHGEADVSNHLGCRLFFVPWMSSGLLWWWDDGCGLRLKPCKNSCPTAAIAPAFQCEGGGGWKTVPNLLGQSPGMAVSLATGTETAAVCVCVCTMCAEGEDVGVDPHVYV